MDNKKVDFRVNMHVLDIESLENPDSILSYLSCLLTAKKRLLILYEMERAICDAAHIFRNEVGAYEFTVERLPSKQDIEMALSQWVGAYEEAKKAYVLIVGDDRLIVPHPNFAARHGKG